MATARERRLNLFFMRSIPCGSIVALALACARGGDARLPYPFLATQRAFQSPNGRFNGEMSNTFAVQSFERLNFQCVTKNAPCVPELARVFSLRLDLWVTQRFYTEGIRHQNQIGTCEVLPS